jgi:hypothetical protein
MAVVTYISGSVAAASASSVTVAAPASIADGDIILAYGFAGGASLPTITPPTGFAEATTDDGGTYRRTFFWKRASSESGDYDFSTAGVATLIEVHLLVYRGCLASGSPVDAYAKTAYTTSNTIVRASSMSPFYRGARVWAGYCWSSSAPPLTLAVPDGWTAAGSIIENKHRTSSGYILDAEDWTPTPTGVQDGTASLTCTSKHAMMVNLRASTSVNLPDGDTFDVTSYGAHANGVDDDVEHIQAVVDACHLMWLDDGAPRVVYLPEATYRLHAGHVFNTDPNAGGSSGGMIQLYDGVSLLGDVGGQTILSADNGYTPICGAGAASVGASGLTVYNSAPGATDGVKFLYSESVILSDIVAHGMYSGLNLMGCWDSHVTRMIAYDMTAFGLAQTENPYQAGTGRNNTFTDCEAYDCAAVAFSVYGNKPSTGFEYRNTGAVLTRCHGHDSHAAFRIANVADLTLADCVGEGSDWAPFDMYFLNVAGARIRQGTAPFLVTSANSHTDWVTYGSQDCTDIVYEQFKRIGLRVV